MIRGVRRPQEVQALGVSRRLMVRVGALLRRSCEVTPAVLECARPGTPCEALLLDPLILEQAAHLTAADFEALAVRQAAAPGGAALPALTLLAGDGGVRVIALREEAEAEADWGAGADVRPAAGGSAQTPPPQPPAARLAQAQDAPPPPPAEAAVLETALAPRQRPRTRESGGDEALFTPHELDRLRLRLLTAAAAGERIEALRILAHAPLPLPEKAELIFRALEDRDGIVRAEAGELLFVLGLPDELGEALRQLSTGDAEVRQRAAARLEKHLMLPAETGAAEAPEATLPLQRAAVGVCTLAALKAEPPAVEAGRLMELLARCGPALANAPHRVAELVRAVVARVAAVTARGAPRQAADAILPPAVRLLRALGQTNPGVAVPLFRLERERCTQPAVEAFLVQVLFETCPRGAPEEEELLRLGAAFLARDTEESRDSRSVGMLLAERGEKALRQLISHFPQATAAGKKYSLRLMDDLAHFQPIEPATRILAATLVLDTLQSAQRGLRLVALGCRFVTHADVPGDLRRQLAEGFLSCVGDFGFKEDRAVAEETVALLGLPAVAPLLDHLAPERPPEGRVQATRILGLLLSELRPAPGELRRAEEAVTEVLRRLQACTLEDRFPNRRELFTALGRLAHSPAASRQAGEVVTRHLLEALTAAPPEREALEGLAWVAASRRATPELVRTAVNLLMRTVREAETDVKAHSRQGKGGLVIEFEDQEDLVDHVPAALGGVTRIAASRSCPPDVLKGLVTQLVEHWSRIASGELVWGPANALFLTQALGEVGCQQGLPDELRMEVLKVLARRLTLPAVLQAVAAILQASDGPYNAPAALTLGLAIAGQRQADGRYSPEDRPAILKALGRIALRRHLGPPHPAGVEQARHLRLAVADDLFEGLHDLLPGAREALVALREARVLPAPDQEHLDRRLTEVSALERR